MTEKNMYCTSPMMIHKITLSVDYNYWLKRLETHLNDTNFIKGFKPKNNVIIKLWALV